MHYSVGLIAIIAIMTVMLYRHPAHAKSVLVKSEYRTITPKDAKESMDAGLTCIRLDVRQPYEYAVGHIPGAVNAPLGRLEQYARNNLKNRDATIYVYCLSGTRSRAADLILTDMGYTRVYDLGGIKDWPYETEK